MPVLTKKVPKQVIAMDAMSKEEIVFASYLNDMDSSDVIAEKHGVPFAKV